MWVKTQQAAWQLPAGSLKQKSLILMETDEDQTILDLKITNKLQVKIRPT